MRGAGLVPARAGPRLEAEKAGFVVFLACASRHGHDAESLRGFGIDLCGYDEFIHVLDGSLILTDKNGHAQRFDAGEFLVMPKGFCGTWETLGNYRELVVIEAGTFADEMSKP